MNTGLIYVFTGEGKGKTSAALGVAIRALSNEEKVIWISLYKQESWGLSEAKLKDKFPNLEMNFVGKGFSFGDGVGKKINDTVKVAKVAGGAAVVIDKASEREHRDAAKTALELAKTKLLTKPFLLVIDEVLNAISEGLLREQDLNSLLQLRDNTNIILTGRGATAKIIELADLVTECRKIKHPYDVGRLAVRGLDF